MLHYQGLSLQLWAEACNTSISLQDRSPHHILGMKTPKEAFSGKRLDVNHFRIFGSLVYFHVTKDAWKKLELTSELGLLVGYTDTPHTYRVYLPTSRRIMVCRDLKFDEQKAMRVSLERELQLQDVKELLVPKEEEPQTNVEQLHAKVLRVETSTQAEFSRDGWKRTKEAEKLLEDVRENPIWVDAMVEEYDSIVRNNVWDMVSRPEKKSSVSSYCLYKIKQATDGSVEKHKAIFIARGFSEFEEIDYDETFAPVARYSSIRSMLALSA
eukprot:PITA_10762